jgi:hypothetical protein
LVEDLLSYDHEELKAAAAEVAMACVDLMRRYSYHEVRTNPLDFLIQPLND